MILFDVLEFHYTYRTCRHAFTAFYAVGVQVAGTVAAAVVRGELHGAYPGAAFAFHLANFRATVFSGAIPMMKGCPSGRKSTMYAGHIQTTV